MIAYSRGTVSCVVLLAAAVCVPGSLVGTQQADQRSEQVTLQNGVTYSVLTEQGMPVPFRSPQVEFAGLGPTYVPSTRLFQFVAQFKLKVKGQFRVAVKSTLNRNLLTTFECTGPGDVTQFFFERAHYPSIWTWIYDDAPTWIPFTFTFDSVPPGTTFTANQWIKLNTEAKQQLRKYWKQ